VKKHLPAATLLITSNGGPITEELAVSLGRYVDFFSIHIEALTPALYRELMPPLRAEVVFPKVEQLIRLSKKPVWIVCPTHKKNLHEVDYLRAYWMNRGAARFMPSAFSNRCTDKLRADEFAFEPEKGCCSEVIASDLIVDWDGAVLTCCQDFLKRNQIGDLQTQSLQEVFSSGQRKQLFESMRAGTRDDFVACRTCYFDPHEVMERELADLRCPAA
jgi:radical SAM protein with 4Fe4S-binding SPASM domain